MFDQRKRIIMDHFDFAAARYEGRKAFRIAGVAAAKTSPYTTGSTLHQFFAAGCRREQFDASMRAIDDAVAYQKLTTSESAKDRTWAELLANRTPQMQFART
jgi:hypothetical protein